MDELTCLIETEIKKKYKSVRSFAAHMDIPQTTMFSMLKNGISGTAYETVVKVCKELEIEFVNYDTPVKINSDVLELVKKYGALDFIGTHTVNAVLEAEFKRCTEDRGTDIK